MINYNNLFFKTGDLVIKNFDVLKRFDTLHDLSTDLFNEEISALEAAKERNEKIEKINELGNFVLLEEESIKKTQSMSQRKQKIKHRQIKLLEYKKECKNAIKQYDKRTIIINAFVSKDILIKNVEADVC